jgi:hypothetical protein
MMITYSQRLLETLLNIDKYNNIVNNTKEYKLIEIKDKAHISLSRTDMTLHSDILSWSGAQQSLTLLLSAACLDE